MNSQRKGATAERELASKLRELGFHEAMKQSKMYAAGHDHPDVVGIAGWHVECKRTERLNLSAAMQQSVADAQRTGERPCVIHRRNRQRWMITLHLDDIHHLVESLKR